LANPAFGERWARNWMDLVRYAESYGHEFDYTIPHAYQYRDYLIRAFNSDVPYDQLIQEHIAGDLLPAPRLNPESKFNESAIGTGFWHFGEAKHGAVDSLGEQAGTIDNQIDVFTKSFLGMTVACARCHDHKFDAIPTSDYYSLAGFLKSSRREEIMLDPDKKIERGHHQASQLLSAARVHHQDLVSALQDSDVAHLKKYLAATVELGSAIERENAALNGQKNNRQKNKRPAKPLSLDAIRKNPACHQSATRNELDKDVLARLVMAAFETGTDKPNHPLFAIRKIIQSQAADQPLPAFNFDSLKNEQNQKTFLDHSALFEDFNAPLSPAWQSSGFAFSMPAANDRIVGGRSIFQSSGTVSSGEVGDAYFGVLRSPPFNITHDRIHYRIRGKNVSVRLVVNGYYMNQFNGLLYKDCIKSIPDSEQFTWVTQAGDIRNHKGSRAHLEIVDHGRGFVEIDEIRFSNDGRPPQASPLFDFANDSPADVSRVAKMFAHKLSELNEPDSESSLMLARWLVRRKLTAILNHEPDQAIRSFDKALHAIGQHDPTVPAPMMALGSVDGPTEPSTIYIRGNHKNQGKDAPRRFLSAIDDQLLNPANSSGRLQLANKITAGDNPLTSRVAVNRLWQHLFGRGIVASVDNFGVLGAAPTHPELLDHLAKQFQNDNWSIKQTLKNDWPKRTASPSK
jgi:cytochrome c553